LIHKGREVNKVSYFSFCVGESLANPELKPIYQKEGESDECWTMRFQAHLKECSYCKEYYKTNYPGEARELSL
jgi:hypothetical protein